MKIELFVTDCPLCRQSLEMVRREAPAGAEILERKCEGEQCCHAGKQHGVHTVVPAVAIDGKIVHQGRLTAASLIRIFSKVRE